jgi:hypothetical protein
MFPISAYGRGFDTLFETKPLEDILAEIATGWKLASQELQPKVLIAAYNGTYEA